MKGADKTQKQIAEDAKVSQPTVVKWLDGTAPNAVHLFNLASANGLSLETFLIDKPLEIDPKEQKNKAALINLGNVEYPEPSSKTTLNKLNESVKLSPVNPQLPVLLERLNRATQAHGKKSELASYLGVELASVSQWLSGKREPGGETTLKMLHWVEVQERKQ